MLAKKCPTQLKPVDFLKVGHHGSHNGTPSNQLDRLLPKSNKSKATIMVSTQSKVYGTQNPVPDEDLMTDLEGRCKHRWFLKVVARRTYLVIATSTNPTLTSQLAIRADRIASLSGM